MRRWWKHFTVVLEPLGAETLQHHICGCVLHEEVARVLMSTSQEHVLTSESDHAGLQNYKK